MMIPAAGGGFFFFFQKIKLFGLEMIGDESSQDIVGKITKDGAGSARENVVDTVCYLRP